jgi:formyltetrahydrofolate-dependent phosphoribosylglycinamide formyltransferase
VTYRVAVAVSGRGSNLAALGEALAGSGRAQIVAVLSDREAAALELADKAGWPTHRLHDPTDAAEWLRVLERSRADLLVLAGYLRLVPGAVVTSMAGRIINIHPALLPRHGGSGMYGRRVHAAVLAAGEAESGATVHLVDEEYDRGEVLGQARVSVEPGDTPETLAARVLEAEHRLLPAAVHAAAAAGRPVPFTLSNGPLAAGRNGVT